MTKVKARRKKARKTKKTTGNCSRFSSSRCCTIKCRLKRRMM